MKTYAFTHGIAKVSIPHRYAENMERERSLMSVKEVSIPHRYAENVEAAKAYAKRAALFQFLIGTLKTEDITPFPAIMSSFNSS